MKKSVGNEDVVKIITIQQISEAVQKLDEEIGKSIKANKWPEFCEFLTRNQIVKVDESIKDYGFLADRAVFPIELLRSELEENGKNSIESLLKKKLKDSKLKPFKNQEGLIIDKTNIKEVKWVEFLKKEEASYLIHYMGYINSKDSYGICIVVYF